MDLKSEEIRFRVPFPQKNRLYKHVIDFKPFLFTCENLEMLQKILEMLNMEYQFVDEATGEDEKKNVIKKMEKKLKIEKIKPFPTVGEKKFVPRRLGKEFLENRVGDFK
jgi:hypothetical protein